MDSFKLRVRVGPHEFEAEGPKEAVTAQFELWKTLIEGHGANLDAMSSASRNETTRERQGMASEDLSLIYSIDIKRNITTLRVPIRTESSEADAILLLLYGFRSTQDLDEVPSTRLIPALELSGIKLARIDRAVARYLREGLLIQTGRLKGTKYRLTNPGTQRAEELLAGLLEKFK